MNDSAVHYLCLTQSPLITLVFQTAMKHLEVPPDSISSISRRSVKPAGPGLCLDDLSDELESSYKRFDRAGYLKNQAELTRKVSETTGGGKFIACLPHLQRLFYQEVAAHPDCCGYVFVEEGFTSMDWQARQTIKTGHGKRLQNTLRAFWTGSRFDARRAMFDPSDPGFKGAFAISSHAFSGMSGVVNVSSLVPRYRKHGGEKHVYVVLDTSYFHRGVRWEDYEKAVLETLAACAGTVASVRVKFHFADPSAASRFKSMREKFTAAGGAELTWLDRDFSIEEALTADDLLLFGVSSLGYYAAIFGARVLCYAPGVKGLDPHRWMADGLLPKDFAEIVGLPKSP